MDDSGHRQQPAQRAGDRDSASNAAMDRQRNQDVRHRAQPGAAAPGRRGSEGFDYFRDAINRTYK
ncbi:MAG: hypothetical protein JF887_05320 [Candidatus Dormibacteraeota bacterium]|uniref:Uncharacterized protein n=1 Tax=Candidatus Amunia macphersoniae TaxID=3127014 RepID=A0A934KE84_9BACT|nr:hypothetical protein [Candidatus Dormibacteraeota bacterium]